MNLDSFEGHTPGPWRVVAKANDYRTTDVVVGKTIVATNISGNDSSLIAAAPDLLQALIHEKAKSPMLRKQLAYDSKVYHEMCEEGIMAWNNAECRLAGEEEMFGEVD